MFTLCTTESICRVLTSNLYVTNWLLIVISLFFGGENINNVYIMYYRIHLSSVDE